MNGKIAQNPYELGSEEACTWCSYRKVCGFDASIPGCKKRKLEDLKQDEIIMKMQEGNE